MGYSIKQKIDICLMAEANPDMTQADLALWAKKHYNSQKPPSQTTISRILAKKDELIALKEHEFKLIRRRRLSNPLLRKVLLEWISQCVWSNIPITAPIIISSASNFWNLLPDTLREGNGEFSYKWCSQFLSKVNINLNNIEQELYKRLKIWSFDERSILQSYLVDFDPKKIFTLDEIFLSHDLPLDKSYYDDTSDFLTCMLCVNADGSEKLSPLIIGRYENYPSFENKSSIKAATKHGVSYHSNRQKWLTSTVFYDWLAMLDKRLALQGKDIIIILDDSASHRVINIKLQRIRLLFTSSSSSSFLPMSWGTANDFRLTFRVQQYKKLLERQREKDNQLLTKKDMRFSMVEIFDLIKTSWDIIPSSRIKSSWKQSGILPRSITDRFDRSRMFDDSLEIKLFHLINELKVNEQWDVLSLLDLSVEQKINKTFLSNEETIQSCIVDNYDDFDHTDGEPKRKPFSHTLGQGLQRLQRLGEMHLAASQLTLDPDFDMDLDPDEFDIDDFPFDDNTNYGMYYNGQGNTQSNGNGQNLDSQVFHPGTGLSTGNNNNNNFSSITNQRQASMDSTGSSTHQPFSNFDFKDLSNHISPVDAQLGPSPHDLSSVPISTNFPIPQYNQQTPTNMNTSNSSNHNFNQNGSEITPAQKLLIIVNFLKLLEIDEDINLTNETLDEVKILYYQYLNKVREQQQRLNLN